MASALKSVVHLGDTLPSYEDISHDQPCRKDLKRENKHDPCYTELASPLIHRQSGQQYSDTAPESHSPNVRVLEHTVIVGMFCDAVSAPPGALLL